MGQGVCCHPDLLPRSSGIAAHSPKLAVHPGMPKQRSQGTGRRQSAEHALAIGRILNVKAGNGKGDSNDNPYAQETLIQA